ncbi:hypothetical protein Tco_1056175 [Tanacetum coccineum]|uniref:Reverse transcriptase zinc-binding domain-containing protein n=1 Tax=Tanacetum coccineum TaxID=301880 RepID=A0ABQ5H459_9ASTR
MRVGNGLKTSLWHDTWCNQSLLSSYISPRDIAREGHHLRMCVADVIANGAWLWPQSWLRKAPNLAFIPVPMLIDKEDCMRWRDAHGNMVMFLVKCAWEALRLRGIEVSWYSIACFSSKVWLLIRHLAGMESVAPILEDIITWFLPIATKHSFNSIVGKLLFGAAAYYI